MSRQRVAKGLWSIPRLLPQIVPQVLEDQRRELRSMLKAIASKLARRDAECSSHETSQRILDTFGSADYAFDKIAACLQRDPNCGEDGRTLGLWGAQELRRVMARFEGMLLARGLGRDMTSSLGGVFDTVEDPLAQLVLYLGGRTSEISTDENALAYVEYLRERFRELRSLSDEVGVANASSSWRVA